MYCNNCGEKIKNGSEYCKYCGAPQYDHDSHDLYDQKFPFEILLVAIVTTGIFILVVFFTENMHLKLDAIKAPSAIEKIFDKDRDSEHTDTAEGDIPATDDVQESMAGSYKATSAVYEGKTMNSLMLRMAGYNIIFEVYEDGTFYAELKNDAYSGNWYRDNDYVEFHTDTLTFTGSYSNDTLTLSEGNLGISVVLEK